MLFHRNPFKEPSPDRCPSFAAFQFEPTRFLMEAFDGLTEKTAGFLAERVFCSAQSRKRVTAAAFGAWASDLVEHMGLSNDTTRSSTPSRGASMGITSPLAHSRSRSSLLSTSSSVVLLSALASPGVEMPIPEGKVLITAEPQGISPSPSPRPTAPPSEVEVLASEEEESGASDPSPNASGMVQEHESSESDALRDVGDVGEEGDSSDDEQGSSRPAAPGKRRKRGARKNRSSSRTPSAYPPSSPVAAAADGPGWSGAIPPIGERLNSAENLLTGLAEASQNLAREINKAAHEKRLVDAKLEQLAASGYQFERRGSADSTGASSRAGRGASEDARRLQDSGRTRPTSWRDRNQSTATVSSIASVSSRASYSSDDASIYTTASAPATYARKSQESSKQRQQRGLFGKSSTGLQPISEKGKKELDASYLAEIFGGSASSRSHHSSRRDRERPREHHSYNGRDISTDPYRGGQRSHRDGRHHESRTPGSGSSSTSQLTSLPAPPSHLPQHPSQNVSPAQSARGSQASLISRGNAAAAAASSSSLQTAPRVVPSPALSQATEAAAVSVSQASQQRTPVLVPPQQVEESQKKSGGFSKFWRSHKS